MSLEVTKLQQTWGWVADIRHAAQDQHHDQQPDGRSHSEPTHSEPKWWS